EAGISANAEGDVAAIVGGGFFVTQFQVVELAGVESRGYVRSHLVSGDIGDGAGLNGRAFGEDVGGERKRAAEQAHFGNLHGNGGGGVAHGREEDAVAGVGNGVGEQAGGVGEENVREGG